MAYRHFGGQPQDVTRDGSGNTVGDVALTVWDIFAAGGSGLGTQITDLKDWDGTVLPGQVTSNATAGTTHGRYKFQAPNAYSVVWLDDGNPASNRWPVAAREALANVGVAISKADQASIDAAEAVTDSGEALTLATGADTRSTEALETANEALDISSSATGTLDLFASLPTTAYYAHRGGMDIYPENTLEAFRLAVAAGADAIETDLQVTADSKLVIMHDATMDRTTFSTGPVSDLTAAAFTRKPIEHDSGDPAFAGGAGIYPPTLEQVLREFGDRVYISMDCKDATVAGLLVDVLDEMIRRKTNVIAVGADVATMQPLIDAGYNVGVRDQTETGATLAAAGVVEMSQAQETYDQARVDDLHANGIRARAYGVTRQYKRDAMLALGVDVLVVNDPAYQKGAVRRTTDPFAAQGWYPGHKSGGSRNSGEANGHFEAGDGFGFANAAPGVDGCESGVLCGWASPIAGDPDNEAYTIDFTTLVEAEHAISSHITVALSTTDRGWGATEVTTPGFTGYVCLQRSGGALTIYWHPGDGTQVQLALTAGTLPTPPVTVVNRITVTATTITFERIAGISVQASTTTHGPPGGYVHLGSGGMDVVFSDVTVT